MQNATCLFPGGLKGEDQEKNAYKLYHLGFGLYLCLNQQGLTCEPVLSNKQLPPAGSFGLVFYSERTHVWNMIQSWSILQGGAP